MFAIGFSQSLYDALMKVMKGLFLIELPKRIEEKLRKESERMGVQRKN